jgi:uncharacterized protein YndB with AHSA1/START domain
MNSREGTKSEGLVAKVSLVLNARAEHVWDALTNPALITQYLFGTNVTSTWLEGTPIVWQGEWQGKSYVDKGTVLKAERGKVLQYTYFSSMSGKPDTPENYSVITITLASKGKATVLELSQDNNGSEEARDHSERNWKMVMEGMKKLVEKAG